MPYQDGTRNSDLPSSWELVDRAETVLDRVRYLERDTYTGSGENGPGVSLILLPENYLENADDLLGEYADRMRSLPWGEDSGTHLSLFDSEVAHYLKEYEHEFDGHFLVDRIGRIYGHMVYVTSVAADDLESAYDGAKMRSLEGISSLDPENDALASNGAVDEVEELRKFPGVYPGSVEAPVTGEILSHDNPYSPVIGAAIRASTGEVEFLSGGERVRSLEPIVPAPQDAEIHRRIDRRVREETGSSSLDIDIGGTVRGGHFDVDVSGTVTVEDFMTDDLRQAAGD